jgi:hypothetical protein
MVTNATAMVLPIATASWPMCFSLVSWPRGSKVSLEKGPGLKIIKTGLSPDYRTSGVRLSNVHFSVGALCIKNKEVTNSIVFAPRKLNAE